MLTLAQYIEGPFDGWVTTYAALPPELRFPMWQGMTQLNAAYHHVNTAMEPPTCAAVYKKDVDNAGQVRYRFQGYEVLNRV